MNDPIFFSYFYDPEQILEHFSIPKPETVEEEAEIECAGLHLQMNPTLFPFFLNTILVDTFIEEEDE